MKKIFIIILFIFLLIGIIALGKTFMKNQKVQQTQLITKRYFGVTVAGPEFQEAMYPNINYTGYTYFHKKGLTIVRLPFTWERMQPTLQGPLDKNQSEQYAGMIVSAQKAGEQVIIEPHNFGRYNNNPLTVKDTKNFADFWQKLAQQFKNYPAVWGYELMNEPHDIPGDCQTWKVLSQSAINAIRKEDTTHYILVPGYNWQSAADWQTSSDCLKNLTDPANKLIYSAHEYFDEDKSGTYQSTCTDTSIGTTRAQPFLDWLQRHDKIGMFTEYGVPPNPCWEETLSIFMQKISINPHIIGGIYWAAGPFWGDYPLSIEPENNKDKPQMSILEKYPSN